MTTETRAPLFYPGTYPWDAISTYMGEFRRFRIAVDSQVVVGMNSAAQTVMLAFASREGAESVLEVVREQLPDAVIKELDGSPDA